MSDKLAWVGLCALCVHARQIPHPRGGPDYWLCGLSERLPEFPKYPRLPVVACGGFERVRGSGEEMK